MIAALAYLTARSTVNRLRGQARRLKNPRYAIAFVLGLGYFYFMFFRQSAREGRDSSPLLSPMLGGIVAIFMFFFIAYTWIAGTDRSALAFTPSEVSMLFTAPVSRRGLIMYKLVRSQGGVLFTSILWYVLFRSPGAGFERAIGSWVLLSTFSLHRLGAALVHTSSMEHGTKGLRRSWIPITIFGLALALAAKGLFDASSDFAVARDAQQIGQVLEGTFASRPLSWVLYPFSVALAPLFAPDMDAWLEAIGPALLLLVLHFVWVLRTDTAFEEAAVAATTAQAKAMESLRTAGIAGTGITPKSRRFTLPLAPLGAPGVALVWKNTLWLVRTGQARGLVVFPLIAAIATAALAGRSPEGELLVVVLSLSVAFMVLVFGPATMRNDLRSELTQLPLLKTMPLRGRDIMLAEVASSATPAALMQYLLVAVASVALALSGKDPLTPGMRTGGLIGAPVLLLGLSLANFTIHNGLALLFPGWVKLGGGGAAGIEAMGQMMLTSILTFTMLALLLAVPAVVAAAVYFTIQWPPSVAIACAAMAAGIVLAGEAWLAMRLLGSQLEKLEPQQV